MLSELLLIIVSTLATKKKYQCNAFSLCGLRSVRVIVGMPPIKCAIRLKARLISGSSIITHNAQLTKKSSKLSCSTMPNSLEPFQILVIQTPALPTSKMAANNFADTLPPPSATPAKLLIPRSSQTALLKRLGEYCFKYICTIADPYVSTPRTTIMRFSNELSMFGWFFRTIPLAWERTSQGLRSVVSECLPQTINPLEHRGVGQHSLN